MAEYLTNKKEIYDLYAQAKDESKVWRKDYPEYERLAENGLSDDLDPDLPETNDGSLSASLFKLPKRIYNSDKQGRAKALDTDDNWITELANIVWEKDIIPNANSQATFHRKWKDAIKKAATYGSVPLVTLIVERGDYIGADFIVVQPQDVKLEPGKVSDYDSDIIFWDVYFSRQQLKQMIARAKEETKQSKDNPDETYNKWDVKALQSIYDSKLDDETREADEDHQNNSSESVRRKGVKFCIAFQRGVDAPFYMYHPRTNQTVREWTNPDPTGDVPVHLLYCYQDFINPYGVGIVKLAGGTQNVLDYMRQADVLATQLGFRPPISIGGDISETDLDSIVYGQDAQWMVGSANIKREEISSQIYQSLPDRISMYKTSLNQLIPTGDTSISAAAGDPKYSKTPAGVKFQQSSLSIDDDDFIDNLNMTYEAVAKSMINTHFANMQGSDLMRLSDDEREVLIKAGLEFPVDEAGEPITNELEIIWDEARATFDFEVEADEDENAENEQAIEGITKALELRASDPNFDMAMAQSGKRFNLGEAYGTLIKLVTKNDKIVEDVSPEEMDQEQVMQEQMMAQQQPEQPQEPTEQPVEGELVDEDEANVQAIMQEYEIDEANARAMLEAEKAGFDPEQIKAILAKRMAEEEIMDLVNGGESA